MKTVVKNAFLIVLGGLGLSVALMAQAPTYAIGTLSGTVPAFNADDTSSISAVLNPLAVVIDKVGNIYFTDTANNRVRKIDAAGVITTIAGGGGFGSTGDAGPATKALLRQPGGLALDSAGTTLYIADSGNHSVRKVDLATGIITLFAGTPGSGGFAGDGHKAIQGRLKNPQGLAVDSKGVVYIADKENNRVRKVTLDGILHTVAGSGGNNTTTAGGFSGDGGPAVLARLGQPQGVAVDSKGNVYIADTANNRVRLVTITDVNGKPLSDSKAIITTVVGGGTTISLSGNTGVGGGNLGTNATVSTPRGLFVDASDKLWISDQGNSLVRAYDPSTGVITTVVGSGLTNLQAVAVDSGGNILVAEGSANRIRRINPDGTAIQIAGSQAAATALNIRGLAVDLQGNVWFTDTSNHRIRKISATNGAITTVAGTTGVSCTYSLPAQLCGDGGPAVGARLNAPWGGTFDSAGNYYFADRGNNRIRKIDLAGNISTVAGQTYILNTFNPFTGATSRSNISQGYYDGVLATQGQLNAPDDVSFDTLGNMYIADEGNRVIRKVDPAGFISTFAGVAPDCATTPPITTAPANTAPLPAGTPADALLAGSSTNAFCRGVAGADGDGSLATEAHFTTPQSVAADAKGNVYIADTGNHAVRVVGADGIIVTAVGVLSSNGGGSDKVLGWLAQLDAPQDVAVDKDGNVYIADFNNVRIRRYEATTNIVTTIAGNGTGTLAGDGGPALSAQALGPLAVAVDNLGNVYFSDLTNRIRKLTPGAATTTP